jgi:hypothetical protein
LSPSPATSAATVVTISTSAFGVMARPCAASSARATFISASRLVDPLGSQSAPSATGTPTSRASAARVVSA